MNRLLLPLAFASVALASATSHAACPTETVVTCTRYGNRLVVESAAGRMVLNGTWSMRNSEGQYVTHEPITIAVPGGFELPLPAVGEVTVTCDPYLAIAGELTALPMFDSAWSSIDIDLDDVTAGVDHVYAPKVSFGMALGEQLGGLGVPVDACSPYFFFAFESHTAVQIGDVWAGKMNDEGKILVNPFDPALIVSIAGAKLDEATAGFVNKVGFGLSRHGKLHWDSQMDLPTGFGADQGFAPASIDAHVWSTMKFGLIPVPKSPVQLYIDGDVAIDLGPWPDIAEEALKAMASGDPVDLNALVAAEVPSASPTQILNRLAIGGNLIDLALSVGPYVSLSLGQASFLVDDGKLRFASEFWTPGTKLAGGETGMPLIDAALKLIVITARGEASGFADKNGYHFELGGNFTVGPLSITNAKLVIDSKDGVTVDRGDLKFDPIAFAEQLQQVFHCDFTTGLGTCKVGGFPVMTANASIQGGNVKMGVKLNLFGLSNGEFELVKTNDGELKFVLQVSSVPMSTFQLFSAKLIITQNGVEFETNVDNVLSGLRLKGSLFRAGQGFRYTLEAQGKVMLLGFNDVMVKASLSNASGSEHLMVEATFQPSKYNPAFKGSELKLQGEINSNGKYALHGNGNLEVAGYKLGQLSVKLSNMPNQEGFTMNGHFDAKVVHMTLRGTYQAGNNEVLLNGTSDLTIQGYTLIASGITLSSTRGLVAAGSLDLGVMHFVLSATVTPVGDVSMTATAGFTIPIYLPVRQIVRAAYCVAKTIENSGNCAGQIIYNTVSVFGQAASCGFKSIMSCTEAIVHQVTETIYKVGSCVDGAVTCGLNYVTDGLKCGADIMWEKLPLMGQCVNDWLQCVFAPGQGHDWCVMHTPQSCLEFAAPRTCQALTGCDLVVCEQVTEWTTPAVCVEVGQELNACWYDIQVPVPNVCENIVVQECYSEVVEDKTEYVGYFNGTVSLTLGSTMAATVTGSYQDIFNNYYSWSAGGSVNLTPSGGRELCLDVPSAALPAGALISAFTSSGSARFCSPM